MSEGLRTMITPAVGAKVGRCDGARVGSGIGSRLVLGAEVGRVDRDGTGDGTPVGRKVASIEKVLEVPVRKVDRPFTSMK